MRFYDRLQEAEHDSPSGVQQWKNHEMTTENKVVKVKEE